MEPTGFNRKLAAILSADVKGYSRLMRSDEEATVRTLTEYRSIIINLVSKYHGRVVDSPGDNILAEFASVVHAVQCGFAIQTSLQDENTNLPEDRRMEFRIGINLGDVIQDGERIYGDGVNVAARMEALADPGGICVSGSAYDQIETKVAFGCEYLGEQTVKNISTPIRVYRLTNDKAEGECTIKIQNRIQSNRLLISSVIGLLILAGGLFTWKMYMNHSDKASEPASVEPTDYPLPDKPSIAVLPFDNMSGDPSQEYIGDGLTEEIITALSKTPKLFVIARNSSFTYKGKSVLIPTVGKELGVRYVLEGSVRKSGNKLRVTAQLIDAQTNRHLWAERYDRELKDIFAVQDEITKKIITELQIKLTEGEQARLWAKGTDNLEAYLKYLQGIGHLKFNKEENVLVRRLAQEAIELDPQYSDAYSLLGLSHAMDIWLKNTESPKESIQKALELAQKAISLDNSNAFAYGLMGYVYTMLEQYEKGIASAERAVAIEPNSAMALDFLGFALRFGDRPNDAIPVIEKSLRLDPFARSNTIFSLGFSYLYAGRYEEAIPPCQKAIARDPDNLGAHLCLAYAYIASGRDDEAHLIAQEILRIEPNFSVEYFSKSYPHKNKAVKQEFMSALRKAGLK
jgi:adenylate cyclase